MEEIILEKGIPLAVDPLGITSTVQNKMTTTDDPLYVSNHGDVDKKWIEVPAGDYVKYATPVFFLQKSWNQLVLPVVETV